jgi:uncharacterized protein with HEPN domain
VKKHWTHYAHHILENIIHLNRVRPDIEADIDKYSASLRYLQTLSESTQRLPQKLKDSHPEILWQDISDFRNILVHDYLGEIEPATIKDIIDSHLEPLRAAVQSMLDEEQRPKR